MLAKLTKPLQGLTYLTTDQSRQDEAKTLGQSMMTKHTCPCCSETLLCHMRLGGLYWRCSYCHQEMPI
jgi:ribosomal protein L37AE/L43A